jgi:hypothetical protein
MKTTINEILKLKEYESHNKYIDSELIGKIYGNYISQMSDEMYDRILIKYYTHEYEYDLRSRSVCILFLEDVPILFWQYIGRGDYENIKVLNRKLLDEIYLDMIKIDMNEIEELNLDYEIELLGYNGVTLSVKDDKLISKRR